MRLWHYKLIPYLSKQRMQGLHREMCALRGRGWRRKHSTVDYVFSHSPRLLYEYHMEVIVRLKQLQVKIEPKWENFQYRGKILKFSAPFSNETWESGHYPEHDDAYLKECLELLASRGEIICMEEG